MPSAVVPATEVVAIPGLTIREFFGNVATKDGTLSVVQEKITEPSMSNPWRCPEFTEYILVVQGEAHVQHNNGTIIAKAGAGVYFPPGCRVKVDLPGPAELVAICLPAFSPQSEHREEGDNLEAPAHATDTTPALVNAVDVVQAPALTITEHFGNVANQDCKLSACVAKVKEPCSEAWQKPEFAEWVLVLSGSLQLEHADGVTTVPAGSGVFLAANERVKWVWPEACSYVPICMPAFTPDGCHREPEQGSAKDADPQTIANLEKLHAAQAQGA